MADSVVTSLLNNLSRLLVDEMKLGYGVKGKIKSLISELRFIDIFLKSSEGKRNSEMVKEVVSQIRDVSHKAKDVVDTYVANVTIQRSRNILSKLLHCKDHIKMLHDVNAEVDKIKGTIDEIYKNKDRYGIGEGEFRSGDAEAAESFRKRRRDVEEEGVVGFMHDSSLLINQLMETDSRLNVVSIIGMGGLGKPNWHLTEDKTKVMDILKLSYDSLPRRLKPCFLYFGIYPEDYETPVRRLIRLWIAEGFIQPLQEIGILNPPELEDVANYYLDELVDRSLVQLASRRSDEGVKTCRIHDLLRDLCISESKADKFLEVARSRTFIH